MAVTDSAASRAPDLAAISPDFAAWIVRQRWFAGHADDVRLSLVASFALPTSEPGVRIETWLVHDDTTPALYQVPLTYRAAGDPAAPADGVIRVTDDGILSDAPRDAAYAAALLAFALGRDTADSGGGATATGAPLGWTGAPPTLRRARVLSGEQSNTSIILELADDAGAALPPAIVKVFRALHHGENPDVVLQSAIAAAGSSRVPASYAAVTGSWPDSGRPAGVATGHLAVVQEFLAGTEDAWRVALRAAEAGVDFTAEARALGAATAEVHQVLAEAMPTRDADETAESAQLASMRARATQAVALVPELSTRSAEIAAVLDAATSDAWPQFQRVHGDYHLGQVLFSPDRGWVLLDFEGEPLRPMSERSEADIPLRDVAGMLRSLDYVAGSIAHAGGDAAAATRWTRAAREAFLDGYATGIGHSLGAYRHLLTALELDKALYECEYEVRNRPAWLPIPLSAVHRLLESTS